MTRRELLAYLAGAIDADGTIGVKKSTYDVRVTKDSLQPSYSEKLALRQVVAAVPELLKTTFGGSVYVTAPSTKGGRPLWSWSVSDRQAAIACGLLLPFLRIKRDQAVNALALRALKDRGKKERVAKNRGHIGSAPRSEELGAAMEETYLRAKKLNQVGL